VLIGVGAAFAHARIGEAQIGEMRRA
jgi:hypothetical protein